MGSHAGDAGDGEAPPPGGIPAWQWAYAAFRAGDGASHAVVPLAVLFLYGMPAWGVAAMAAAMNLAAVPGAFLWSRIMERGRGRRRLAVMGFIVAAAAMALMATVPPLPLFVAAGMAFAGFGIATAPAASVLVLEGRPRREWAAATGLLTRNTSVAYLAGFATVLALGLVGTLPLRMMLGAGATLSLVAAGVAWSTIPAFQAGRHRAPDVDPATVVQLQRRFERTVFFPGRLRFRPSLRALRGVLASPLGGLLVAVTLLFMGSVMVMAGYPGVLRDNLGFSVGLILLAQAPNQFITPFLYRWSGRVGSGVGGERRAIGLGIILRVVAVPGICLAILLLGPSALWALLLLQAVLGVSFALLQVNTPVLCAAHHPRGMGDGVGAYHAAVATGMLVGAFLSFLTLLLLELWVGYALAGFVVGLGALLAWRSLRAVKASGAS